MHLISSSQLLLLGYVAIYYVYFTYFLLPTLVHFSSTKLLSRRTLATGIIYRFLFVVIISAMSYYYAGCVDYQEPHFLDACFLCRKPLGFNSDIFMYRGNAPFCSKECRQEQIEIDESKERSWKKSSSSSARKSESKNSTNNKTVRTGTVAVA